jgi:putative tricarboxylic transport membrane protein
MGLATDRDVISGAALAALGVFILTRALEWSYLTPDGPGPGFFPVWYGVLMLALSLYLVLKAVVRPDPEARTPVDWRGTGRALATWTIFAGSIALMEPLGFGVAFALLALGVIWLVMRKPLHVAASTAVVSAVAFWLVFVQALGINLPPGHAWAPLWRVLGSG